MTRNPIEFLVNQWAQKRGIPLEKDQTGRQRNYFYISSKTVAETFQVVIEPEIDNYVRLDAHLIETEVEREVHYIWNVPLDDIIPALDTIIDSLNVWFIRAERSSRSSS